MQSDGRNQSRIVDMLHNQDKVLKVKAGKKGEINLLEIIYLPLYGSKSGKKTPELFDMAIKLTPQVAEDRNRQQKLQDLLILLTSTFIDDSDFRKVLVANMRALEDSTAVRVLGEWGRAEGRNQALVEVAENMLRRGRNIQEVSEDTGLDLSRVAELQEELHAHAV